MSAKESTAIQTGQRVQVIDPALAQLRQIMEATGVDPEPNHYGVVDSIEDGFVYINFDDGVQAPYPIADVRPL